MSEPGVWSELSLRVQPEASESIASLLQEITGSGVTIEPAIEALGPDEGYVLDESAPLTLRAYLYGSVGRERRGEIEAELSGSESGNGIAGAFEWKTVQEEDWAEA
jgi:hypothetical protein